MMECCYRNLDGVLLFRTRLPVPPAEGTVVVFMDPDGTRQVYRVRETELHYRNCTRHPSGGTKTLPTWRCTTPVQATVWLYRPGELMRPSPQP